ncbi:MAG: CheY-like chemotaxis protein [Flavobacterium sp.]|jgi:CheY-like chemotaxis protein
MGFKYKKIMIIDDSEIDNYIVKVLINNNNIAQEILEFNNGMEAIEYLESNRSIPENLPEVILLDIYMPVMDGFEFMKTLNEMELDFVKNCKICIVSSSIDNNDVLRTKSHKNVFNYVSKPITAKFLASL